MSRIIDLQRRLREIGRIRIGEQVPAKDRHGNDVTRPAKLDTFRLTSRDRTVIEAAAQSFGGDVQTWTAPDGPQWEVRTTVAELPVIVPPGDVVFSQAYEQWSAGGCQVRCDGQYDQIGDTDCHCDPDNRVCKIHTRLSVILPDLPGLGVWRIDTQGWYAAVELGGVVDLCSNYSGRGLMLPARLRLEQRSTKRRDRDGNIVTLRFAVPVLDVDVNPMTLAIGGTPVALGSSEMPGFADDEQRALPSPNITPVPSNGEQPPSVREQLARADQPSYRTPRSNAAALIPPTGLEPRTRAEASESEPVCAGCGFPLAGHAVVFLDGQKVHKDACPTVSAPEEPGGAVASVEADPDPDKGPVEPEAEGAEIPAVPSNSDDPDHVVTDKDLLILAGKVFASSRELVERPWKTKTIEACRHGLIWLCTDRRTFSSKDLTLDEKRRLWLTLKQLSEGFLKWELEVDADGVPQSLLIVHSPDDVREVAFNELTDEVAR